ncbi:thioesterase-like superfamily-domain-containing protein [Ilyonectria robusta]|uniref:thioesterase-like superfamily-domain-containing protein n=1 Tax=Ilyonectria robusta TaxID=1079257 RepID=UPI001E8E4860|nr:thioesterase-like superfamily-domain-containing protein [Ilyonectria robusta]KAH8657341.1 thioesterase-like superfamily-domain-containing protein [Ilyonectria robusta]
MTTSKYTAEAPSQIQRALSFRAVPDEGGDTYTNAEPLWHPIWGRGIFGGAIIAQSLAIAQDTVPSTCLVHSMHCHFIRPGSSAVSVLYNVERVRDGRNIATRRVQANQSGKCVFTATISFMHETSSGTKKMFKHQLPMPNEAETFPPPTRYGQDVDVRLLAKAGQTDNGSLFECVRFPPVHQEQRPELRRLLHWIRIGGAIDSEVPYTNGGMESNGSQEPNHKMHLAALAYMSDSYFIGTVSRVHRANRFNNTNAVNRIIGSSNADEPSRSQIMRSFKDLAAEEANEISTSTATTEEERDNVEMMVSLDHTIFFHNQRHLKADQWMLSEMETPWAGDERGIVVQRIWTSEGVLVATCFQEGLIRLLQDQPQSKI